MLSPTRKETSYRDRRFWCSYILFIIIIGGILVLFIYITRLASKEIFSPSNKIHREVGRAKDLSTPLHLRRIPHLHSGGKPQPHRYELFAAVYRYLTALGRLWRPCIPGSVIRFSSFQFCLCQSRLHSLYRVIHKSVKHFKNSQQIDYSTDHGISYADRERNSPSFFLYIYFTDAQCIHLW